MSWKTLHNRGEILRTVIEVADTRVDGRLPMDVDGVRETFGDELTLLAALQLRWYTRLSGRIERELAAQPMDLEAAVIRAWHSVAAELPGVRAIVDHHRENPLDEPMAGALSVATAKERALLAVMAGQAGSADASAAKVGARIEDKARGSLRAPRPAGPGGGLPSLVGRIKAVLRSAA